MHNDLGTQGWYINMVTGNVKVIDVSKNLEKCSILKEVPVSMSNKTEKPKSK